MYQGWGSSVMSYRRGDRYMKEGGEVKNGARQINMCFIRLATTQEYGTQTHWGLRKSRDECS